MERNEKMKTRTVLIVLALSLIALCAAGCGKSEEEEGYKPEAEGTVPATSKVVDATKPPESEASKDDEEDELDFSQLDELSQFESYRISHLMTWKEEGAEEETVEIITEFVREPPAERMVLKSGEDEESSEFIRIDDTTYMNFGDEWMATQASSDDFLGQTGWLGNPEDLVGAEKGKYLGKENVNGLSTKHYRYTQNLLTPGATFGKLEKATADVWVSTKYDVYVKAIFHWEGTDDEGTKGTLDMETNVTDINEPITIELPEGVEKPSVPEDIPLVKDAKDLSIFGNMVSYQVSMSQDKVVEFYEEEMPKNGWDKEEGVIATMMSFTKEDRSVTIMVGEEGDGSTVTIMLSEGE